MSLLHTQTEWSLLIYRVSGDAHQQRILHTFRRVAWPGVTVLGTNDEADRFVIVDCESGRREQHARAVIMRIDPDATRILRSRGQESGGVTRPRFRGARRPPLGS